MAELTLWQAVLLGVVQGLTEFLPVSSSGHLVLTQHLLGFDASGDVVLAFDVMLHVGTLVAVISFFYRDILAIIRGRAWRLVGLLIVATLPAAIIGLWFKDVVASTFASLIFTAWAFLFTGLVLLATRVTHRHPGTESVRGWQALFIGLAQVLSLFPGISRSGMTLSAGLFARLTPREAARFAFLMSIPAIGGAVLVELPEVAHIPSHLITPMLVGTLASGITGYLAIRWMLRIVARGQLWWFGVYCVVLGSTIVWIMNCFDNNYN